MCCVHCNHHHPPQHTAIGQGPFIDWNRAVHADKKIVESRLRWLSHNEHQIGFWDLHSATGVSCHHSTTGVTRISVLGRRGFALSGIGVLF